MIVIFVFNNNGVDHVVADVLDALHDYEEFVQSDVSLSGQGI
jgi:hypothetical protein